MIYLALADSGLVMAHFSDRSHCADFCNRFNACEVAFNLFNRTLEPAPLVGAMYRA